MSVITDTLKTWVKPLVIAFLRAELPVIIAKMREKNYSEASITIVTDIITGIINGTGV